MTQKSLFDFNNMKIIRDLKVFDLKHVPPRKYFYEREELKQIAFNIKKYVRFGLPTNMFIYGTAGTGKTASVKILERDIKESNVEVNFHYISGRDSYTKYRIYTQLCGDFTDPNNLSKALSHALKGHNIIVIDEADHVRSKDLQDVCFLFSRWGEVIPAKDESTISLILIANKFNLLEILDVEPNDPVVSSLQPDPIYFKHYEEDELYRILLLRAEEGLVEGAWDDEVLKKIAEKCASEYFGDARYAILALERIATICEARGLDRIPSNVDIEEVFNYASTKLGEYTVQRLDKQSLLILYATILCDGEKTVEKIYEKYFDICFKFGVKFLKRRRVYDYIQSMQSLGLVNIYKLKSKRKGRPKMCVEVSVDEEYIINKIKSMFGDYG